MENGASGIGHRASGIGHRASGIIIEFSPCPPCPPCPRQSPQVGRPAHGAGSPCLVCEVVVKNPHFSGSLTSSTSYLSTLAARQKSSLPLVQDSLKAASGLANLLLMQRSDGEFLLMFLVVVPVYPLSSTTVIKVVLHVDFLLLIPTSLLLTYLLQKCEKSACVRDKSLCH